MARKAKDKKQLGFIGEDQWGKIYHIKKYPRKELCELFGTTKCAKMYCDNTRLGITNHVGYVIKGAWITLYRVYEY